MSTTTAGLTLDTAEQAALICISNRMTWAVSDPFCVDYEDNPSKMLHAAGVLTDAARVALAGRDAVLPDVLMELVRPLMSTCLEEAREAVDQADQYRDDQIRRRNALELEGLERLTTRLAA